MSVDRLKSVMAEATKSFRPLTPRQINEASCFKWAYFVFDRVPGSMIGGHQLDGEGQSYIVYQGLCYDAETPAGVKDWRQLKSFRRMLDEM